MERAGDGGVKKDIPSSCLYPDGATAGDRGGMLKDAPTALLGGNARDDGEKKRYPPFVQGRISVKSLKR